MTFFRKLIKDTEGATAIEYGLIAALIAVALITAMGTLKTSIASQFGSVATALDGNHAGSSGTTTTP